MRPGLFLKNKIERQLDINGVEYTFDVVKEDKYKQLKESGEKVTIIGLYHESLSYQTINAKEGAKVIKKMQAMILTLQEYAEKLNIGYKLSVNDRRYKISGIVNVQNYSVAAEISLEEVL